MDHHFGQRLRRPTYSLWAYGALQHAVGWRQEENVSQEQYPTMYTPFLIETAGKQETNEAQTETAIERETLPY